LREATENGRFFAILKNSAKKITKTIDKLQKIWYHIIEYLKNIKNDEGNKTYNMFNLRVKNVQIRIIF